MKKLKSNIKNKLGEKKTEKLKKALKVARVVKNVICWTLVVVLVFAVITFLLARVSGGTPAVFGYSIHRIETGSMEPALHVGDVILSKEVSKPDEIKEGDIITFTNSARFGNRVVTHRVLVAPYEDAQGDTVLVTKGDANEIDDGEMNFKGVRSKMLQKIGFLKKLYDFFFSPWGLIIFIGLLILIFFDEVMNLIRLATGKYDDQPKEESIGEIIERIQREDAEQLARDRHERAKLEDYGEDSFDMMAEPQDVEDPDPEEVEEFDE